MSVRKTRVLKEHNRPSQPVARNVFRAQKIHYKTQYLKHTFQYARSARKPWVVWEIEIWTHSETHQIYTQLWASKCIRSDTQNVPERICSIYTAKLFGVCAFFLSQKIFNAVSSFVHILKRIHVVVLLKKPLFCCKACHSRDTCMENTKSTHLHQLAVGKDNAATHYLSRYLSRSYLEVSAYTAFLSSPVEGCA